MKNAKQMFYFAQLILTPMTLFSACVHVQFDLSCARTSAENPVDPIGLQTPLTSRQPTGKKEKYNRTKIVKPVH